MRKLENPYSLNFYKINIDSGNRVDSLVIYCRSGNIITIRDNNEIKNVSIVIEIVH